MIKPLKIIGRTKCIHNVSSVKTIGIHSSHEYLTKKYEDNNNIMFHFYEWGSKKRFFLTNKTIKLNLDFLK